MCTAAGLLLAVCCQAQLKKGTVNIGFTTTSLTDLIFRARQPDYKFTSLSFSPTIGYQLSPRVETGGGLSFIYLREVNSPYSGTNEKNINTNWSYGLNAYLRYYFTTKGKLLPYGLVKLEVLRMRQTYDYSAFSYLNRSYSYTSFRFGGGIGLDYRVSPKLSVLGEVHIMGNTEPNFPVYVGYDLHLGMRYRFLGKRK